MSTFNLQEAESDAHQILRDPVQYGHALCNWSRDFLALAVLYREAVEALEEVLGAWVNGREVRQGITLSARQHAEAVLAKAREAGEKPQNP